MVLQSDVLEKPFLVLQRTFQSMVLFFEEPLKNHFFSEDVLQIFFTFVLNLCHICVETNLSDASSSSPVLYPVYHYK